MQLNKLLEKHATNLNQSIEINNLCLDSRKIKQGDLFIAQFGLHVDGRQFISQAITNGAVAVLQSGKPNIEWENNIPIITLPELEGKLGLIAATFFDFPSRELTVIAVTGTNGKTSFCYLLTQVLTRLGMKCGMIGTLGNGEIEALTKTNFTTPDAIGLQRQLADFRDQGMSHVMMEVSSHALHQGRVNGVEFHTAVFTNLTRDHLDYHSSFEAYAQTKKSLFDFPSLKNIVMNSDDPYGQQWALSYADKRPVFAYSIAGSPLDQCQNLIAKEVCFDEKGITATVETPWGEAWLRSCLLGRFNLSNLLAVMSCLCALKIKLSIIVDAFGSLKGVPGRVQTFKRQGYPLIVVDYAHTPDALEKVLQAVREHQAGELVCVFGCGGDRDRGKRTLMAQAAEVYADRIIVTNDNPRNEDPQQIVADIKKGFSKQATITVELNRAKAIKKAITQASEDGIVLIAGKGHEDTQTIGDQVLSFSDIDEVQKVLGS